MKKSPTLWQKSKRLLFRLSIIVFIFLLFLVIYLDSKVSDEFNQQAWNIPAKVFARPLAFSLGQELTLKDLKAELALLGYRQKIKATSQGEYESYANSLVIYTRDFKFWDGQQKAQVLEVTINKGRVSRLLDFASQKSVSFLRLDPLVLGNIQAGNNEDRQLIQLDDLPEFFTAALLVSEDREFYDHWGVSPRGIARALWNNISQGQVTQGGSTLTQQLMKNHFLTSERSLWRKLQEAIMAMLTEFHYDKSVILQAYINEVYLGQNHNAGIFGFARASEFYFDRPIHKLNLSQVALLVGMVKGPSFYNPRRNPKRAKQRRDLVLSQLLSLGLISQQKFDSASKRSLMVVAKSKGKKSNVPAFMGFVKRELRQEYSLSQLHNQGLRLFTSLDPLVQKKAEKALTQRLNILDKNAQAKGLQGAVVVSDIKSGDIIAMVGDRDSNFVGFNRAIDAYRQTGSVIKPFVYLAALRQSNYYHLQTPISDTSFNLIGNDGSEWSPQNYDKQTHGQIPLQEGLINSYNMATARLALDIGIDEVVDSLGDAGFERPLPAFPSLALGAEEMSPLEVLRLYQVIANDGVAIRGGGIVAVQDHQGQLLQRYPRHSQVKFEPETIFQIKHLLTQVVNRGTAKAIGQVFPDKQYAGKTGTTNDLKDSWYAGFGGEKLAVVWLGKDDNSPSHLTGASGALTVWRDLFKQLNEPSLKATLPEGLVWGYPQGGFFSRFSDCHNKTLTPFIPELLPEEFAICEE